MDRLHVRNMRSRESNRLPAMEVRNLLGPADKSDLPVELQGSIYSLPSSDKYIIYIIEHQEFDQLEDGGLRAEDGDNSGKMDKYILVRVIGHHGEVILDCGHCTLQKLHCLGKGKKYLEIHIESKKIGKFAVFTNYE